MARINCDFFSEVLEVSTSMTVLLPQRTRSRIGLPGVAGEAGHAPVLYLLHGLSDDHTGWQRWTSAERYAALGLAVVMPAVPGEFLVTVARRPSPTVNGTPGPHVDQGDGE